MSWAIWITGLPGSGKSTIARAAAEELAREGEPVTVLEMGQLRRVLTPSPTYSDTERETVYRSLVWIAMTLTESGRPVIIDATAHRRRWRELARGAIPRFAEIQLTCPLEVCRDRRGPRPQLRAVDLTYEPADAPQLEIDTDAVTADAAARRVIALARSLGSAAPRRAGSPPAADAPWAIWITGLPGSGKTTTAFGAARFLGDRGLPVRVLSFNEACHYVLCGLPAVASEDIFHRALVYAALQLTAAGVPVIVDATARERRWRELARTLIGRFAEVQLSCPREICASRERAVRWSLPCHAHAAPVGPTRDTAPDVAIDYQPALAPELVLYTDVEDPGTTIESVVVLAHRLHEAARRKTQEGTRMNRLLISSVVVSLVLAAFSPAAAQHGPPAAGTPPAPHHAAPPPGDAMGRPMMGGGPQGGAGMCSMMAGGMMAGPMGMRDGGAVSPQMLQMRGEMMKAMGDVMMKYGKLMETQPR